MMNREELNRALELLNRRLELKKKIQKIEQSRELNLYDEGQFLVKVQLDIAKKEATEKLYSEISMLEQTLTESGVEFDNDENLLSIWERNSFRL